MTLLFLILVQPFLQSLKFPDTTKMDFPTAPVLGLCLALLSFVFNIWFCCLRKCQRNQVTHAVSVLYTVYFSKRLNLMVVSNWACQKWRKERTLLIYWYRKSKERREPEAFLSLCPLSGPLELIMIPPIIQLILEE